jgi:uncharacterized membrane protein YfcA
MLGYSVAGLVVGIAVGATGVGGGSLMTPILILVFGISPALAVGTDLLYASISKAFAVVLHGKNGSVDWMIVANLALGSVPAALLAVFMIRTFGPGEGLDQLIKVTLSLAIIVTASATLFRRHLMGLMQHPQLIWVLSLQQRDKRAAVAIAGAGIGALVAISSVGAGVIGMMILLVLYPRRPTIQLVGSDLAHAVIITGIAGLGHASMGTVDYGMLGYLLLGALPGIYIGTRVGFRLQEAHLRTVIAGLLLFIGAGMLIKTAAASL